jgi:predicted metal-binding membrane protein
MAAMMLPGAIPAVARRLRIERRTAPLFAASYFALWTIVALALGALDQPGAAAAGVITIAAGLYELTPIKRNFRLRCQEHMRSGVQFGLCCVGASLGLMAMLAAMGAMSFAWMAIVAALVVFQKLLPPRARFDIPLALAIVALGVLTLKGIPA